MILAGVACMVIAFASFARSFDEPVTPFGAPRAPDGFWLGFVGVPLIGVGSFVTKWAFVGPASLYVAGEVAPAVTVLADATRRRACPKCGSLQAGAAFFCDDCGTGLAVACRACGGANDADAGFCAACGRAITRTSS